MRSFVLFLLFILSNTTIAQIFELNNNGPLSLSSNDSRSANWIDINNDGHLDIFISNGPSFGQNNVLYTGDGNGNWTFFGSTPMTSDLQPSDGASFADALNIGFLSGFVANWYNKKNLFYYRDSTTSYVALNGVPPVNKNSYSETGAFGDFDKDGFVDLYVSNSYSVLNNLMYHNNGDGTFSELTSGIAVTDQYSSRSVNWIDFDNDGDQDLFVSNENGEKNNLYRNDSIGVFTPLNAGPLVNDQFNSMSSCWGDYDNDGDFDVFISNYGADNQLYRNDGNEVFTLVSDTVGLNGGLSFGASWGDVDNDGDLDLFVGNAFSSGPKLNAFFYLNNGDGSFSRNTSDTVTKVQMWNYGNAFGDYDLDGDLDLLTANCYNGSERNHLFTNTTSQDTIASSFIGFECVGTISNRSAIGTKVRIKANINGQDIWQLREVSSQSGYCGQNMLKLHFGLDDASIVDSVIIEWTNGLTEVYTALNASSYYRVIEGQGIGIINHLNSQNIEIDNLEIYPIPSRDKVNIRLADGHLDKIEIELFTLQGLLKHTWKKEKSKNQETFELDISGIESGMYLMQIKIGALKANRKIVIE